MTYSFFNWITLSILSAVTFAFGDLVIVKSGIEQINTNFMFIMYTIITGLANLAYLAYNYPSYRTSVYSMTNKHWMLILSMSGFYMIAYLTHFFGLQKAPNPGYANALVMFHVAILTILSYLLYNKPLNRFGIIGILLMMIGAYYITIYSS